MHHLACIMHHSVRSRTYEKQSAQRRLASFYQLAIHVLLNAWIWIFVAPIVKIVVALRKHPPSRHDETDCIVVVSSTTAAPKKVLLNAIQSFYHIIALQLSFSTLLLSVSQSSYMLIFSLLSEVSVFLFLLIFPIQIITLKDS